MVRVRATSGVRRDIIKPKKVKKKSKLQKAKRDLGRGLVREKVSKTVAIKGPSGTWVGRRRVRQGDGTSIFRVKRSRDVDGDGKIDYYGGTILGRTKKLKRKVRASRNRRAHVRNG